jgi:hypothetical protein
MAFAPSARLLKEDDSPDGFQICAVRLPERVWEFAPSVDAACRILPRHSPALMHYITYNYRVQVF